MPDRIKNLIRRTNLQVRSNLSFAYQQTAAADICMRIRGMEPYRYAKKIAFYKAINGEIDLTFLWNSAPLQGKHCYFPVINEQKTLDFLPATPVTVFKKNKYQIDEPDIELSKAIPLEQLDIIFLPLVAFDVNGTRLGMGAGYYDRTLANVTHPMLIGLGYEFQRCTFIEPNAWDIPLEAVVTQHTIYWCKK